MICETIYGEDGEQIEIITIKTSAREVCINEKMNGFQEMAGYLLDNLEKGEINQTAV